MTFKRTYPGAAFDADGNHVGPGPWLDVIRTVNGLAHDEGLDSLFGSPTYADDDVRGAVEIYRDATVSHDYPVPDKPALPDDSAEGYRYGVEWDRVVRERDRIHNEWLRDPRNTVTITSKNDLGERLLTAAHAAVAKVDA